MNINKEIALLTDVLDIAEIDLAMALGVSLETIHNWKNGYKQISDNHKDTLYNYAYSQGIRFNDIYEQILKEEYEDDSSLVLFHGAKKPFSMPIDIASHSKDTNDFGKGFYLGETFTQAAAYIANSTNNKVFAFKLDFSKCNTISFKVNTDWMLTIAFFRGWLNAYAESKAIKTILSKVQHADIITAPIADNRMFDIINEFTEGVITDKQCQHALASTNLGYQYVLKTDKAIDSLISLKEMYVSTKEKGNTIDTRISLSNSGLNKVKMARIEYRGKGKYIEELLK